ncbi:MarR family winged helix-turn-helix transcriptional regulator [Steroidobacter agaridevorans]|uniref:MarR family winged helix-turn-helix transcriptional regulator n=1 Tax=Steroidobacter agaridevorans TaxID=2695856 RepID=UPI001323E88B|nr:MarR family winged helix-turn-helix transcriptional regulator [Steroidobacter agaridevorans]GFE86486.1 MarR family transcriptional regulator [Steroidobacter agaridevorans]
MPAHPPATLGTLLRHLIEKLDGAVEQSYVESGLAYRPRYTPVVRALMASGPASIRSISRTAGITHSAASQTVAQMVENGLVRLEAGSDARERIVVLTPAAKAMIPKLEQHWHATNDAARMLDSELSMPLSELLREAIAALDRASFTQRIDTASAKLKRSKSRKKA